VEGKKESEKEAHDLRHKKANTDDRIVS